MMREDPDAERPPAPRDPAAERLFAGSRAASSCLTLTIAALFTLTGKAAIWAIPLALVAYQAAALPLRRVLYNETWSVAVYLSFVIRFFIAFWTFWILVCALPALAFWAVAQGINAVVRRAEIGEIRPFSRWPALVKFFTRHVILAAVAYVMMVRLHLDPVGMLVGVTAVVVAVAIEAARPR